jgi:ribonuclease R
MSHTIRGSIHVHERGFGFVTAHDADPAAAGDGGAQPRSAFLPPALLNRFLQDDVVDADVVVDANGRATAAAARLVERPRTQLCGRVGTRAGKRVLRVDRAIANTDWPLDLPADAAAGAPDVAVDRFVVADITVGADGQARARVARVVDDTDVEIEALLVRWRIIDAPGPAVVAAASAAPVVADVIAAQAARRRDLRDLVVVTIDGPSTKDIDDALAAFAPDDDGALRVLVAIADVDALVPSGSVLDGDARARATSVYLPDRVIPMLPRALSEDRLSLVPDEDRLCLWCELRIDPEGGVVAVDVGEGVMRSKARLTYDAVRAFLDDGDGAAVPASTQPTLRLLRAAAARLSVHRAGRGGVAVDRAEAKLALDAQGRPHAVVEERSTSAHILVERLMVAANEAIARFLVERGLPALFRVHDAPDRAATTTLAEAARALGIEAGFSTTTPLSPRGLAAFDAQIKDTVVEPAARALLRRLLGPARYDPRPAPHFGLAAPLYLHFTSPIRRYADLVVHRVLKDFLAGRRDFASLAMTLPALARSIDEAAARATRAEVERTRVLVARALQGRIGERFNVRVVGHKPFGTLVALPGIHANLPDVPGAERPALGSALDIVITAVDVDLGRVEVARAPTTAA